MLDSFGSKTNWDLDSETASEREVAVEHVISEI